MNVLDTVACSIFHSCSIPYPSLHVSHVWPGSAIVCYHWLYDMDSESRLLKKPFEKDCLARSVFKTIDCILEESLPIGKFKTNELVTPHMRLTLYKARTVQAIMVYFSDSC